MLLLLLFFGGLTAYMSSRRLPPLRFDFMSTLCWLASFLFNLVGAVDYLEPISNQAAILIIASHGMMLLGYYSIRKKKSVIKIAKLSNDNAFYILIPLAMVFIALSIARSVMDRSVPVFGTMSNIAINRAAHVEGNMSTLDQIVMLFCYTAIPFAMLIPVMKSRFLQGLWIITCVMLVDQSMQSGSRSLIIYLIIGIVASWNIVRPIKMVKAIWMAMGAAALFYLLGSQFYLARNANFGRNVDRFISISCPDGRMSDWMSSSPKSFQALTLSSCYFSGPPHTFSTMLRDWGGGRSYGTYNFNLLFPDQFAKTRADLENYFSRHRWGPNLWATSTRDYWLDFGYFGAFFAFMFGAGVGLASRRISTMRITDLVRLGIIANAAFLMPSVSPLIVRFLLVPFLMTYLVDLGVAVLSSQKDKYHPEGQLRPPARFRPR